MDYKDIIVDVKDHVAKLTFNRPQQNNSFTVAMLGEILSALEEIANDSDAWVVMVTGAGKHFCTSTNMDEFMNEDKTTLMADYNSMQVREFVARYPQKITKMLAEMPRRTIPVAS